MIKEAILVRTTSVDPAHNLALEEILFENLKKNQIVFYLWQNKNTVVIGKNQNSEKECRLTLLQEEGGTLVRRMSGGGAVYHDMGNLNFTFIANTQDYDVSKNFDVIINALGVFGIQGEKSGRNDLIVDNKKFSGNAFYTHGGKSYHHGTLLVDVDKEKMSRYLNPSKLKLLSKGIESTKSRVVNLKQLNETLTITSMFDALINSFEEIYNIKLITKNEISLDKNRFEELNLKYQSNQWNYNQKIPFTIEFSNHFNWGEISIQLNVNQGIIENAVVYSDCLDVDYVEKIGKALNGTSYQNRQESLQVFNDFSYTTDIINLLKGEV